MAIRYCPDCGASLGEGLPFCEQCGNPIERPAGPDALAGGAGKEAQFDSPATDDAIERNRPAGGRTQRVLLALGIVAAVAAVTGLWIAGTWRPPDPKPELPSSGELFPIQPSGVDSIHNTIDGKPVAIGGDGHVMNSPGLNVNRPVWCLVGPDESVFSVQVEKTTAEGTGTFRPGFQVLIPELVKLAADSPEGVAIRLSLHGSDGDEDVKEFRIKPENRWQPLDASFAYATDKAPYRLRFEARGFEGAVYIDRATSQQ